VAVTLEFGNMISPILISLMQVGPFSNKSSVSPGKQNLSKKENNSILYKFHHSIHYNEHGNITENKKNITIGWGTKEGPLTEIFSCNNYYDQSLIKKLINKI